MTSENANALASYLGITVVKDKESKSELSCLCPFHADTSSSFGINYESELFNCFAGCGSGGLRKLIKRIKPEKDHGTISRILKKFGAEFAFARIPSYDELQRRKENVELEELDDAILDEVFDKHMPKYFTKRGFGKDDWELWKLRSNPFSRSIVFPVYKKDGTFVGWTERFVPPLRFKNRYAQFLNKSSALYGEHLLQGKKHLVIVEGNLDVIRARRLFADLNVDVVGLIGIAIQDWQVKFIKGYYDHAIIMLDNDEDGQRTAHVLQHKLKGVITKMFEYGNLLGKDVCEVNPNDCISLMRRLTR